MLRAGQTSLRGLAEPAPGAKDVRGAVLVGLPKSEPDMLPLLCLAGSLRNHEQQLITPYCTGAAKQAQGAMEVRTRALGRLLDFDARNNGAAVPAQVLAQRLG